MNPCPRGAAALVACLVLAAGCATAHRRPPAPPERDTWYSISDGEQRYGYLHIAVRRLDAATFEYSVATQAKVEFLGARQELGTTATLLVGADLEPLGMETRSVQQSGNRVLHGRLSEGRFLLESELGDRTRSDTVDVGEGLIFDITLYDRLHRMEPRPGEPQRLRVLAMESGEVSEVTARLVERGPAGSTWTTEAEEGLGRSTLRLDSQGLLLEQVMHLPPARIERSSRDVATRIEHRRIPDRELLVFTPEGDLPPQRRLKSVRLRLAWRGIPPDELVLHDSHQRVESLAAEEDGHAAVVVLERPGEIPWDTERPVPAAGFEATLGESAFIEPFDPGIAAAAREVVGEERSALAAVRALCAFVHGHIDGAMIAETLSGPEVLELRTGKCSEYTTLFASLARAAGVPTRVALGQRRFDGSWGGHMWNEVYVGEWVPVDASVNEVGGSTSLLKLIHSDTVEGTQPLRWKLTESLALSIEGYELVDVASGADGALATGLREGVYVDAERGFEFSLPDPQWRVEGSGSGDLVLRLRPPDDGLGDAMMIHLVAFDVGAGLAPRKIFDGRLGAHRANLDAFELLLDEPFEVDGARGHRIRFRGLPRGEGGVPLRVTEVVWIRGETGCLLNLIATEELHDAHLPQLESVLSSFRFFGD